MTKKAGNSKPKIITPHEALERLKRRCSARELCQEDIRQKLFDWGVYGPHQDDIIITLISEGFIDEERYASAFAHDKLLLNQWGPIKITQELKTKKISSYSINKALKRPDLAFDETMKQLVERYTKDYSSLATKKRNAKIASRLIRKGFPTSQVYAALNKEQ